MTNLRFFSLNKLYIDTCILYHIKIGSFMENLIQNLSIFDVSDIETKNTRNFLLYTKKKLFEAKSFFLRSGRQWLFRGLSVFLTGFFFFHVKRCEIGQLNFAPLLFYQLIDKEITLKLITSCYTIGAYMSVKLST